MAEEKKPDKPGTPQEPEDKKDSFVEIDGKKFKEDPENRGQPLKDDKGNPIPFEEKGEDIDYKAEFEKEEKRREQADYTIKEMKRKKKEEEEEEGGEGEGEGEGGTTPDETRKIAREEASKILRGVNQGQVKTLARSLSRNEDEYNLIMFHYENSIVLTGNLQEDLENAQVLANKKRIRKELDEVQRTIQSKKDEGGGEGAGQKEQAGAPPPKLTPENQKLIQRMRAKWDPKRKLFVTPSGRTWNPKE